MLAFVVLLPALVVASCASRSAPAGPHGAATGGGSAARPTPTPAPAGTVVRAYLPFDATGHLRPAVDRVARGQCFTASAADPVPHAYRCLAGNALLDPCFAVPTERAPATVSCLADPWSRAVVVTLTRPLPTAPLLGDRGRPWAFELSTGPRCTASTGTVPFVDSVALSYRCSGGLYAALVDPRARTVVAQYGRPDATVLKRDRVAVLWRG